jgi:hypothetical protein
MFAQEYKKLVSIILDYFLIKDLIPIVTGYCEEIDCANKNNPKKRKAIERLTSE